MLSVLISVKTVVLFFASVFMQLMAPFLQLAGAFLLHRYPAIQHIINSAREELGFLLAAEGVWQG